jgi:general secretion pathway protein A
MSETQLGPVGLKEAPFTEEIADTDFWLPSSKAGVVDELCEAVSECAPVLLTGDPGVVKTCVLLALRKRLTAGSPTATRPHSDAATSTASSQGHAQPHPPC